MRDQLRMANRMMIEGKEVLTVTTKHNKCGRNQEVQFEGICERSVDGMLSLLRTRIGVESYCQIYLLSSFGGSRVSLVPSFLSPPQFVRSVQHTHAQSDKERESNRNAEAVRCPLFKSVNVPPYHSLAARRTNVEGRSNYRAGMYRVQCTGMHRSRE